MKTLNVKALNAAIRIFFKMESASGILLLATTGVALIVANTHFHGAYESILQVKHRIILDGTPFSLSLREIVNEGLMTLFFLLIGLELKIEWAAGRLDLTDRMILPCAAALGGMVVPALIYLGVSAGHPDMRMGWAIPTATDIAFSLGVLSLFGRRVPAGLIFFLMLLAILDDAGAVLIIALFYGGSGSVAMLGWAAGMMGVLMMLGRLRVNHLLPWCLCGAALWGCLHFAGIHPVLSGVLLAIAMPAKGSVQPAGRLLTRLHPYVAFGIMPLFALVNAGVSLWGGVVPEMGAMVTAIALGLVIGKPLGIMGVSSWLVWRRWVTLPGGVTFGMFLGVASLCGIGFTMSLFIGTLAFQSHYSAYIAAVKQGVLLGSLVSGVIGAMILYFACPAKCRSEP